MNNKTKPIVAAVFVLGISASAATEWNRMRSFPDKCLQNAAIAGKGRVYVYQDASPEIRFRWIPDGFMPNGTGISLKVDSTDQPFSGKTCVRVRFNLEGAGWRGVYWLANGWKPALKGPNLYELLGIDPKNKKFGIRLVFHARSPMGACIQFKVGGIQEGESPDSILWPVESPWITLTSNWTAYKIDLKSKNLSCLQGGFCFTANDQQNAGNEIEFFIDDVFFEAYPLAEK